MTPPIFISLKPQFADLVFQGRKRVEFRRRIVSHVENSYMFVYVTSPTMELRGGFQVGQVWSGLPEEVWRNVHEFAGVDRQGFDDYFEGQSIAYALEIKNVWEYQKPVELRVLRSLFSNFVVPQSWRYVKAEEHEAFQQLERRKIEVQVTARSTP